MNKVLASVSTHVVPGIKNYAGKSIKQQQVELERQYLEYRGQFELWKDINRKNLAGQNALLYMASFEQWEKEVDKRRNSLKLAQIREENDSETVAKPESKSTIDDDLDAFLTNMNPMTFMITMMSMMIADPLLMTTLTTNVEYDQKARDLNERQKRSQGGQDRVVEGPNLPPAPQLGPDYGYAGRRDIFGKHSSQPYGLSDDMWSMWGDRARPPVSASHSFPPKPPLSNHSLPPGTPLPPGWTVGQPIRRTPRELSPFREYLKPERVPFKDFSLN